MAEEYIADWIQKIKNIINKEKIGITLIGREEHNEIDIILSELQTNRDVIYINLAMKNLLSKLFNLAEKIGLLIKEIDLALRSFESKNVIIIKRQNEEIRYYYNYRLDSYLTINDIRKLTEAKRRLIATFKQIVRKLIYLILSARYIPKEELEIKEKNIEVQPITAPGYFAYYPYPSQQYRKEEEK